MGFAEILLIAFSLGIDAFAVSVSLSFLIKKPDTRQKFRIYFHFGLFQFLFPIVGFYLIKVFHIHSGRFGHFVGGLLLIFLGLKMLLGGFKKENEVIREKKDATRGLRLVLFSSGVSIDALSAGVSMALINRGIFVLALASGIITAILSYIGISHGSKIGVRLGEYAEFFGGLILILLGVKIGFL